MVQRIGNEVWFDAQDEQWLEELQLAIPASPMTPESALTVTDSLYDTEIEQAFEPDSEIEVEGIRDFRLEIIRACLQEEIAKRMETAKQ